jgi:hypothetical protein
MMTSGPAPSLPAARNRGLPHERTMRRLRLPDEQAQSQAGGGAPDVAVQPGPQHHRVPVQPPSRRSAGTSAASSHGCPATSAQLHRSMTIASLAAALSRPMPFHRSRTGREADALDPAADLALARRVQGDAVDWVLRQAADGQRRTPVTGRTAAAVELLHPAGRVEPRFGEGRSRMDTPITSTCRQQRRAANAIEYPSGTAWSRRPWRCSAAGGAAGGAGQVARRPPVPPAAAAVLSISAGGAPGTAPGLATALNVNCASGPVPCTSTVTIWPALSSPNRIFSDR